MSKHWCWELEASGAGPDWLCRVTVAESQFPQLLAWVETQQLPDFQVVRYSAYCGQHGSLCEHYTLIDQQSYPAFVQNVTGTATSNIWIYNSISLHKDIIEITHGYAGHTGSYAETETALLHGILALPGLEILHWGIYAGGETYPWRSIAEGQGNESFRL